jgi:glycosyltransferase involved in cell wall biosynthesis
VREVVFIQSRFPTSKLGLEALLGRWEAYACELEEFYGIPSISVVAPFRTIGCSDSYPHLSFVGKSKNAVGNVFSFIRLVKSTKRPLTLICGDNQFSLFVSVICRWLFPGKVLVQCQFHGDLYTSKGNPGPKGLIRVLSSRFAFHQADSIRIVSEFQESEIKDIAPDVEAKFIISPIPIDYSKIPNQRAAEIIYDVVVVGRLHEERGIEKATLIIKEIVNRLGRTRIAFVGEGKYMGVISQQLAKEIESGSVELLGALSGGNLRDIYASSKVLLSAAPREGYGLALREACLSGMVVVAKNSAGAREAGRDFLGRFVFFESVQEAASQILHEVDSFSRKTNQAELVQIQKEKDAKYLKKLFESWVVA